MIADKDGTGIFIVTSNGICFMNTDGTIQTLENFPYYNNYDIVEEAMECCLSAVLPEFMW